MQAGDELFYTSIIVTEKELSNLNFEV